MLEAVEALRDLGWISFLNDRIVEFRKKPLWFLISVVVGGLFSFSAVAFSGFYYAVPAALRPLIDIKTSSDFFLAVSVSFASAAPLAVLSAAAVWRASFWVCRPLFRLRNSRPYSLIWAAYFRISRPFWRRFELLFLLLIAAWFSHFFLGFFLGFFWLASCVIFFTRSLCLRVKSKGPKPQFLRSPFRVQTASSNAGVSTFQLFITALLISLALLGATRLQFVISNFALVDIRDEGRDAWLSSRLRQKGCCWRPGLFCSIHFNRTSLWIVRFCLSRECAG